MGLVLLAFDGIGLGHLRRMEILAREARALGLSPRLFVQGWCPPHLAARHPVTAIGRVYEMNEEERESLAGALTEAALDGTPGLLIEDTHPSGLVLDAAIGRHLVVRPTTFDLLEEIRASLPADGSTGVFVADHPDSPTWPYGPRRTEAILSWGWTPIGPLHHGVPPTRPWRERPPTCVVSVGGGGEHPGREDMDVFVRHAERRIRAIRALDADSRFVFHPGPYFPADVEPPEGAEVIAWDPRLPESYGDARAVLVRPGFNTLWECMAAGTPFEVVRTTTWKEPVEERLATLARRAHPVADIAVRWRDAAFLQTVSEALQRAAAPWPGVPDSAFLRALFRAPAAGPEPDLTPSIVS